MTSTTQTSTPPKDMVVADGNDFSLIDTGPRDGHQTRASEMSAIALVQARTLMAVKLENSTTRWKRCRSKLMQLRLRKYSLIGQRSKKPISKKLLVLKESITKNLGSLNKTALICL